jgi:hypothetical protein
VGDDTSVQISPHWQKRFGSRPSTLGSWGCHIGLSLKSAEHAADDYSEIHVLVIHVHFRK